MKVRQISTFNPGTIRPNNLNLNQMQNQNQNQMQNQMNANRLVVNNYIDSEQPKPSDSLGMIEQRFVNLLSDERISNNYFDKCYSLVCSRTKRNIYSLQKKALCQYVDIKNYIYLLLSDKYFLRNNIGNAFLKNSID